MATPRKRTPKKMAAQATIKELGGLRLLGEVITWNPRNGSTHTHAGVVKALADSDLDSKVARELLPRHAFARACRKMQEERTIDLLTDDRDELTFQFTQKFLAKDGEGKAEMRHAKEAIVTVDKTTGRVGCNNADIEAKAQTELDRCMDERTTSDITGIVQKLFGRQADLIPVRDQGGVYFVPEPHRPFADKIEAFLGRLGGRMTRFPVPAGTQSGDRAVQESVADYLGGLIADHEAAVEGFTLNTRQDTITSAAERINLTRVKIEAYAEYLKEKSEGLIGAVEAANVKLATRIDGLTEERKTAPPEAKGGGGVNSKIYTKWIESNKTASIDELFAGYEGIIKRESVKWYIQRWTAGKNIPTCAKE